jgi:hypothetical protein
MPRRTRTLQGFTAVPNGIESHHAGTDTDSRCALRSRVLNLRWATWHTTVMAGVFINYRHDDSGGQAGRLYDHLVDRYGQDLVLRDLEWIKPGMNFVRWIEEAVGKCSALLAVIGRDWATTVDISHQRRLDNPKDLVRLEIVSALERDTLVVPVLVENASMPSEDELPDPLKPLAVINAIELSDKRWRQDVKMLEEALDEQTDLATATAEDVPAPSQAGPLTVASAEQPAVAEAVAPITTLPNLYGRWIFENPLGGQVVLDFTPQGFFAQGPAIAGPAAGSWLFNPGVNVLQLQGFFQATGMPFQTVFILQGQQEHAYVAVDDRGVQWTLRRA